MSTSQHVLVVAVVLVVVVVVVVVVVAVAGYLHGTLKMEVTMHVLLSTH